MAGELVFLTGAAGFVGAQLVNESFKAGYRVRGTVRREAQVKQLKAHFGPQYGDKAEFIIVPDMTKEGAYDGMLDGVDYIFHVASPLPSGDTNWKKDYIEPAILGTTTILEAATKVPSIKRVVVTSSIAALKPIEGLPEGVPEKESNIANVRLSPDFSFANSGQAYRGSKILADKATTEFVQTKKPHFTVVTIHPSFIYGYNLLQSSFAELSPNSTNGWLLEALQTPNPAHGNRGVHILDVTEAHLRALKVTPELDPDMDPNSWSSGIAKFMLSVQPFDWNKVGDFVREKYPQAGSKIEGSVMKEGVMDTTRAEKILGLKHFRSIEAMVAEVIEQQLSFADFQERP
ncbi:3-beta hydroxysteroid dehydrogenase/isomerase family protein [Glonium stellatum]|uniref:3-beta hydroxysteroid dehydrogenase/isomerase family protein n=1 Tax=Glonium stellatum TaxID=574774 RepID=A0A8E2JWL4_9PEZI|nr:3-beta hydroxysteroid dehydrogenase/isomerase family protein [Glonium stellatum]